MKTRLITYWFYTPGEDYDCPHEEVYDTGPIFRWEIIPEPDITPKSNVDIIAISTILNLIFLGESNFTWMPFALPRGGITMNSLDEFLGEMLEREIWEQVQQTKKVFMWLDKGRYGNSK